MRIKRADLLRELVEDAEGYTNRDEWRSAKRNRPVKSFRESSTPKGTKDKRRAWRLQRALRHGELDFQGNDTNKTSKNEDDQDD